MQTTNPLFNKTELIAMLEDMKRRLEAEKPEDPRTAPLVIKINVRIKELER